MTEAGGGTGTLFVQGDLTEYRHVERSDSVVETSPTLKQGMSRQARHDGNSVMTLFRYGSC